jgi:hypothetical protein
MTEKAWDCIFLANNEFIVPLKIPTLTQLKASFEHLNCRPKAFLQDLQHKEVSNCNADVLRSAEDSILDRHGTWLSLADGLWQKHTDINYAITKDIDYTITKEIDYKITKITWLRYQKYRGRGKDRTRQSTDHYRSCKFLGLWLFQALFIR